MTREVDADFLALPLDTCADAGLTRARELGAAQADVRVVSLATSYLRLRNGALDGSVLDDDRGISVRVVVDGCWGFAASDVISPDVARALADRAVLLARASAPLTTHRVELADEPTYAGTWVSAFDVDPFAVPESERVALIAERQRRLQAHDAISTVMSSLHAVKERTFYADLAGTRVAQQRVRIELETTAIAVDPVTGAFETMTTQGPPAGRGWEYITGDCADVGGARRWDWDAEAEAMPELLAEKLRAPSVEPGRYDLVIDAPNLYLTIHESVGHATELDRALGYEANYAGTSFATPDLLGTLKYGSSLMHVTGDRTEVHGLSTVGWDDEGVAAQSWDLVRDGVLVGHQLDRSMAAEFGHPRSNGCAYSDMATHTAIQRMPNVSLQADPSGPDLESLIAGVEDGILVQGNKSWSIDMQRFNFQFTGQQFHRIKAGRLVGQVKDVAYQSSTTDFWGSLIALGGPQTYLLGGALNCGKGQPAQVAPVSHGTPAAVFEKVNVLNASQEGGV
ncbi:MAG TPA: TldD/PmbA family protein [Candidatus Nanopelagicales bacterium]|nr:TldD/PmbA family protein [Candidatus Nanopelagicales bacterium]